MQRYRGLRDQVADVLGVFRIPNRIGKARDSGVRRVFRVFGPCREWSVKETHLEFGITVFDQRPSDVPLAGAGVEQRELRLRPGPEVDAASDFGELMGPVATEDFKPVHGDRRFVCPPDEGISINPTVEEQGPPYVAHHVIRLGDGSHGNESRTSASP